MGEAKRRAPRKAAFLKDHPVCCYCGIAPSEELDHCPPQAYFASRHAPNGYEFPSCIPCNRGTSHTDLVIAAVFAVCLTEGDLVSSEQEKRLAGLVRRAPEVVAELMSPLSRNDVRRTFRKMFGPNADAVRASGLHVAAIGVATKRHLIHFGEKLTRALFYKHAGRPLRSDWRTLVMPFASPTSLPQMERILSTLPIPQATERNSVDISGQFSYRYNFDPRTETFAALVILGSQFTYLLLALPPDFWGRLKADDEVFNLILKEQCETLSDSDASVHGRSWRL